MDKNQLYRNIPKVDVLLEMPEIRELTVRAGHEAVMSVIRRRTEALREMIASDEPEDNVRKKTEALVSDIACEAESLVSPALRPVINATGTILHTNLGRAPISRRHAEQLLNVTAGYCNLEYDLKAGKRGKRYDHFENLLCTLTGAEAAMAVNNNAAAVMLILSSMAKGGEVVVSRGELVEIGGAFRIPDVCEQSGAVLVETGTTNKTHFSDYENKITERTKALMKVHTSNYSIVGFSESVSLDELRTLGDKYDLPVIQDLGSGVFKDLTKYGLTYEPTVQDSIKKGVDVVCFSGDKLLGGPQAGIIVGKKKYLDLMKKNQLTRALRIDKFTAAALEMALKEYLVEEDAEKNIPVLRMLSESPDSVADRAEKLSGMLREAGLPMKISTGPSVSMIGGGSLPLETIPSRAVILSPENITVSELERAMRKAEVPMVARVVNDCIHMDVRTIDENCLEQIVLNFKELLL